MNKLLWVLILIAIILFPFDPNIIINRVLGMGAHLVLYIILIGVIIYMMKGRTLGEKISNLRREITRRIK